MTFNSSLKYRIIFIVFSLEAIMMAIVFWQIINNFNATSFQQAYKNEQVVLNLISSISKTALTTQKYAQLQPHIEYLRTHAQASQLMITDADKKIIASLVPSDVGKQLPEIKQRDTHHWQTMEIRDATIPLGLVAIEFPRKAPLSIYTATDKTDINALLISMLIIAAAGMLIVYRITPRLMKKNATVETSNKKEAHDNANRDRGILQAIMDYSPAVVYVKDVEGKFIFINQQFMTLFQKRREDIIGKTLHGVFPKDIADEMRRNDKAVLAAGHALESEETALHPDGIHAYFSAKFPLFNDADQVYAVCGISTDVTERKKLENEIRKSAQHLKLYRDQAPLATIEWNTDTQIVAWNAAAEKIFGYTFDEIKGRNFIDVILPKNTITDIKQPWEELMAQTNGEMNINENLTKDGRTIFCEWHNTTLKDEAGNVIGAASIVQDINERKQQEEQLRRSQKMRALGKLTGGIAHDYNNMLGVILGYAELLAANITEQPKLTHYINEIHHAGARGSKLTQKLLSFSRQNSPDATMLDINTLLKETQLMLEKTLTARIRITFDLAENLWPVYLDSSDLEDTILNLSINAMHAIEGSGQLTFITANDHINKKRANILQLNAGDYVSLSTVDTGCGLDKKTMEKVFEPFFSTKGKEGTGLGLSQIYGFVQRSGGAIKVHSELGHGAHFTIYFPRYYPTNINDNKTKINLPEKNKSINSQGKETILLVDDEPALLKLAGEILGKHGYNIFSAESGKQALIILKEQSVDLLFSDVIMPEMDGYQLATTVQEKYPDIKIQLTSGFSDNRHINCSDETLHKTLLGKPYNAQVLLQTIHALLVESS